MREILLTLASLDDFRLNEFSSSIDFTSSISPAWVARHKDNGF